MDAKIKFKSPGPSRVDVDLTDLPTALWYEDRYRGYLDVFERIAALSAMTTVVVHNAPWSWVPLLQHLRAEVQSSRVAFKHCDMVRAAILNSSVGLDRTALEVLCSFRPETADALWKCDMQWESPVGRIREYLPEREFIVTTNGSYHREEVKKFMDRLKMHSPRKRKALLVPCAADKPYPAPMHRACLNIMPADFYMINATGVVGLIPQDLWPVMPHYDSGIPNQWRLFEVVQSYFTSHEHDEIVVYCDFYNETIWQAFRGIGYDFEKASGMTLLRNRDGGTVRFVLPVQRYDDYMDLMQPRLLHDLEKTLTHER